jgi:hypothetical protein
VTSRGKPKPGARSAPEYVSYREPKTQAVELIGLIVRRTKTKIVVKPIAMRWGPRFIRVGYMTHRLKPEDTKPVPALPVIEIDGPRRG